MEYGLIGERLPHSFSKEIHEKIADYDYSLKELKSEELEGFILNKNYKALNVTIPYKQTVIPYLDEISAEAQAIGAVNTIVNKDGVLYGYNTDFGGMRALAERIGLDMRFAEVLILGTGGTSRTAAAVCERLGAEQIIRVSRSGREGSITYDEAYDRHTDADIIINTTPCGMYPDIFGCPIELDRFTKLSGVMDAVYNPLNTSLVLQAQSRGIPAEGGLYMLVAQAVLASQLFTGRELDAVKLTNSIFDEIHFDKQNIVLTGMPGSGKSTVGRLTAERLGRDFIDTDALIVERYGEISAIFAERGEKYFRDIESEIIRELAPLTGKVVATGGGAILRDINNEALRRNGALYFIDRSPEYLIPTSDRPLADERAKIDRLYKERIDRYLDTADYIIDGDCEPDDVADSIINGE